VARKKNPPRWPSSKSCRPKKNAAIALANLKAAEEKAALEKAQSQRIIFALGVSVLLALFLGIGLGSSARKKADQLSREWHG
jgi:hypothetical protein